MQRTLSVRMDVEDYEFVKKHAKESKEEISKAVRELVDLGRVMLAIESYKKGTASIGKAAELAGLSISEMMETFSKFGIKSNVEYDDYLKSIENLRKTW
ncbi:MAG TPA: UPF0175 family protein [Candidatus Nanoarchaeia archaeon]|nr:UPF0175 family protein [Candidatus Nanoarchaeia archaeon]